MKKVILISLLTIMLNNILAQNVRQQPGSNNGFDVPFLNYPSSIKTDRFSWVVQKDAEQLMGCGSYNFDGMYLKNLNLSFIDFSKGGHRGTLYENVNLRYAIGAKKNLSSSDVDFTHTYFSTNTLLHSTRFTNWRMQSCMFNGCSIDSSFLSNTILENCTFSGVKIKNTNISHKFDGYWNNVFWQSKTQAQLLSFSDARMYNSSFIDASLTIINFTNSYLYNTIFVGIPGSTNKAETITFYNDSILNLSINNYKLTGKDSSLLLSRFENCYIENLQSTNSEIGASFVNINWKLSQLTNVHFLKSYFDNVKITGGPATSTRIKFTNCNFSRCSFNNQVVFTNCDFSNCKFPPKTQMPMVQFSGCTGQPEN